MQLKTFILFLIAATLAFGGNYPALKTVTVQTAGKINTPLPGPLRLAVDRNAKLYVTAAESYICKYDSAGRFSGKIKLSARPIALAVYENFVYVSLQGHPSITQLDTSGNVIRTFGSFLLASDMAIDDAQKLYVVDSKNKRVYVYDLQGNALFSFASPLFLFPTGITIDKKNRRILVTEHGGIVPPDSSLPLAAVHVFDMQGNWLEYYGHYGGNTNQFTRMQGLATDNLGRMFIADSYQGMIKVLDSYGNYLAVLGKFGFDEGGLAQPMDVVIDRFNHLWVSSYNSNTVLKFEIKGLPVRIDNDAQNLLPQKTRLMQNFPNPFNGGTIIPFILGTNGRVTIHIYNASGQRIRTINLGIRSKGNYLDKGKAYYWDGKNAAGKSVASGVYYYELRTDNYRAVRRMLLIK